MGQAAKQAEIGIPGREVVSLDPATGEEWARFAAVPPASVQEIVEMGRRAQGDWFARGLSERRKILQIMLDLLFAQRRDIAALITRESGKPLPESMVAEIMPALDFMAFNLKRAPRLLQPRRWQHHNMALKFKQAIMVPQPWGVVGIITPWNYPLMQPIGVVFPALLAGNSVVLKPAEYTTSIAMRIQALAREAGVPEAVFQVIPGDGHTGAALVKGGVDRIVFIGSERAGRQVARAAAENLIPVTLELGGSDPMVVLADAVLHNAAAGAIWGRFANAGQTCVAVKRVFVEEPVYEQFVDLVVAGVKKLRLGNGAQPGVDVGPMIREVGVATIERQLQDAVQRGAHVRIGGRRRPDLGPLFFEPTVLTEVSMDMAVMQEETFGPLLPIVPVKNAEEALEKANASVYGLSGSVWTRDRKRGYDLARRIQAGSVTVNDATFYPGACDVPYGGFKNSGIGKSHGDAGLLEMVKEQYIDVDFFAGRYKPWWFGYADDVVKYVDDFTVYSHARAWGRRLRAIPRSLALLWHRKKL